MRKVNIEVEDLVVGQRVLLADEQYDVEYVGTCEDNRMYFKQVGDDEPYSFHEVKFNGEYCFNFSINAVRDAGMKRIVSDEDIFQEQYDKVMISIQKVIRS